MFQLDQEEDIYGGLYVNNELRSIGPISMNATPDDLLEITQSDAFGKRFIRFSGTLGANYARSVYVEVYDDGINQVVEVDGHVLEIDLDEDGIQEVIATFGTIPNTSVYQIADNSVSVVNINDSIHAQSVLFHRDNHVFEVYFEPNEMFYYVYNAGNLEQKRRYR